MTALFALIRKDLLLFLQDRRALILNLAIPIVLGYGMGAIFGNNGGSEVNKIDIAVVTQDGSSIAKNIAAALKADKNLDVQDLSLEAAKEKVLKGKLTLTVVIPAGFGDAAGGAFFGAGVKPELAIFYDPSRAAAMAMVRGILTQHVMQQVSAETFSGAGSQKFVDKSLNELEASGKGDPALQEFLGSLKKYQLNQTVSDKAAGGTGTGGLSVPFTTKETEMTSGTKFNGFGHSFTGMGVQFILMMSIDIGVGILLARRMGMWNRLLAAPISLNTVLAARMLSGTLIAFCLMCIIFLVATVLVHLQVSNPLGFVGVTACFALMTATFGLLIAAFGKTPEASRGIAVFVTLIMVMLGGAWIPSFMFPAWVQSFTLFVPTRWAIDGISAVTWRGLGMEPALQSMGALLVFAAIFGVLAFWKFNRDSQQKN